VGGRRGVERTTEVLLHQCPAAVLRADVLNLPLHGCSLYYLSGNTPPQLQHVRDILDTSADVTVIKSRSQLASDINGDVSTSVYNYLHSLWTSLLRKFFANFDASDASTHHLRIPTPKMNVELRTAIRTGKTATLQYFSDKLEAKWMEKEPPPIPIDRVAPTAIWWKRIANCQPALQFWQFRYTIKSLPLKTRLSHIPQANSTDRKCRNCKTVDETHEHLFVECPSAVELRNKWKLAIPSTVHLTDSQLLDLWTGQLGPWFTHHRKQSRLVLIATKAIIERQKLFNTHKPP